MAAFLDNWLAEKKDEIKDFVADEIKELDSELMSAGDSNPDSKFLRLVRQAFVRFSKDVSVGNNDDPMYIYLYYVSKSFPGITVTSEGGEIVIRTSTAQHETQAKFLEVLLKQQQRLYNPPGGGAVQTATATIEELILSLL
jgi:hypothetical protein